MTSEEKSNERVYTLLGYIVLGVIAFVVITGTKISKI
nr:MAG TPA: Preprotein translocase subunit SecE, Preprotein, archaeal, ribosomal, 50S, protein.0A [Caudoviricetes sp.]